MKFNKRKLIAEGSRLDAFGGTKDEVVSNTVETNSFNLDLDSSIFRIFQFDYLINDITNQTLTYCKPSPEAWGDDYEAFLSRVKFLIPGFYEESEVNENMQYSLSMGPALDNYYALCWTADQNESKLAWDDFSYGQSAVRVKTTPRKLLSKSINVNDIFFNLSHFIGKVKYLPDKEFEDSFENTPYYEYLDSLGHGLANSFFVLGESFKHEKEVRLLYAYHPKDNEWAINNVNIVDDLCSIPFDWSGVIDEVVLCPNGLGDSELSKLKCALTDSNSSIQIKPSTFYM